MFLTAKERAERIYGALSFKRTCRAPNIINLADEIQRAMDEARRDAFEAAIRIAESCSANHARQACSRGLEIADKIRAVVKWPG